MKSKPSQLRVRHQGNLYILKRIEFWNDTVLEAYYKGLHIHLSFSQDEEDMVAGKGWYITARGIDSGIYDYDGWANECGDTTVKDWESCFIQFLDGCCLLRPPVLLGVKVSPELHKAWSYQDEATRWITDEMINNMSKRIDKEILSIPTAKSFKDQSLNKFNKREGGIDS